MIFDSIRVGMASDIVKWIIDKEEIKPYILYCDSKNKVPEWNFLLHKMNKKYNNNYTQNTLIKAQVAYYYSKEDWRNLLYYLEKKIALYPPQVQTGLLGDAAELNDVAWNLFLKCSDEELLNRALKISELAVEKLEYADLKKDYLDTNANIRYKLGDIKTALEIEKVVIELAKRNSGHVLENDNVFLVTYNKMLEGKPTWD